MSFSMSVPGAAPDAAAILRARAVKPFARTAGFALPPARTHSLVRGPAARPGLPSPAEFTLLRLQIPQFPLRVLLWGVAEAPPCALLIDDGDTARIWMASAAALRWGICCGIELRAALALCPDLQVLTRERAREQRVREEMAGWWSALGFRALAGVTVPATSAAPVGDAAFGGVGFHKPAAVAATTREPVEGGDLTVVLVSQGRVPTQARLQRDLRALGFRVRLADVTPARGECASLAINRHMSAVPVVPDAHTLVSEMALPWPARGAQALHLAVSCMFDALRVHAQARRAGLVRATWSLTQACGVRDQYALDWPIPVRADETLVRQARERLLRHPPAGPVTRLALRAELAPG